MLAISIDENGFEIDNQGGTFYSMSPSTIDCSYSLNHNGRHILCIGKLAYEYSTKEKIWSNNFLRAPLDVQNRMGAAGFSLSSGAMVVGGVKNGSTTDAIDVLNSDFTTSRTVGKLPIPLIFHTVTKISESEFVLCGGINDACKPLKDVYYGRVVSNPEQLEIEWAKLKPLNSARYKHCAVYIKNRLIVIGGDTIRNPLGADVEILELNNPSRHITKNQIMRDVAPKENIFSDIICRGGWKVAKVILV